MRGRPGCPTEQKKNSVGAIGGSPPLFYKERLGTGSPPHPPQCAHWGTFPPRGRLWGGGSAARRSWDYSGSHVYPLIWKPSFAKMLASIFFSENAPQIGLSIPEGIAPLLYQRQQSPKRASDSKRALKKGGRGPSPATLCVRAFFGRKPEERTPGASPLNPGFYGRSFPLAGFGVSYL